MALTIARTRMKVHTNSFTAASRATDATFLEKRFFVMATTIWRDICAGHHCGLCVMASSGSVTLRRTSGYLSNCRRL
jgi:hypothetical protein